MHIEQTIKIFLALFLAIIPAVIWGYIFYKKQHGQKSMSLAVFCTGALAVSPLLLYKYLWQFLPWINAFQYTHPLEDDFIGFASVGFIPLSVIVTFMLVGFIEEITKLWAVKISNGDKICSIDDSIEMFITAGLGFAFAENILYFYNIMLERGVVDVFYPFIFRSLFSTFAHIMFSGVLGYYYGLALFAKNILNEKKNEKKWLILRKASRLLGLKKDSLFHEEKIVQGTLIAMGLHAFFNIFLEMNWVFLLVPFLSIGYLILNKLLDKKELHKMYCVVGKNKLAAEIEKS